MSPTKQKEISYFKEERSSFDPGVHFWIYRVLFQKCTQRHDWIVNYILNILFRRYISISEYVL